MAAFESLVPGQLTVCTYTRFAPFCYEDAGSIVGTDISLLTEFAEQEGLRPRFEATDFPEIWKRPGRDECDTAAAGIAAVDGRDPGSGARWSAPYACVRRSLLIRSSDVERFCTPEDFAGRSIVATRRSTADIDARLRYQTAGATVVSDLITQEEAVRRLLTGDVDAYAGGETSNRHVAALEPRVSVVDVHEMDEPETLHFAVRHADPRLLERLDAFIQVRSPTPDD